MKVPQDVIIQFHTSGYWILYNVFTQNSVAVSTKTLELLRLLNSGTKIEKINGLYKKTYFEIIDIEKFLNFEGLLVDPTRQLRNLTEWPKPHLLNVDLTIDLLKKKFFIVNNEKEYKMIFGPKSSLLDKEHVGNFHQQLGQYLILNKRIDPKKWWIGQKFNENYELKNTLYKSIQENFLLPFFNSHFNKSHTILDLGCGIGYYSKLMAKSGANVLGIDPNENYIQIAKRNTSRNVSFKLSEIGKEGSLDWIETNKFDFVLTIDALLFYFVSPDTHFKSDIKKLLSDIKRILKPNGHFLTLDPHGIFFLRPWLGEIDRPFTIITEYKTKRFNITPNFEEITSSFLREGFIIRKFKEIYVNEKFEIIDKRATNFTKEFPLWWFFDFEPKK